MMIYIYTYKNLEYTIPDDEIDRAIEIFKNAVRNWGNSQVSMDWVNDNAN